jgi:aspartokinase
MSGGVRDRDGGGPPSSTKHLLTAAASKPNHFFPFGSINYRARDSLVSFGERLSTRIFAALLVKLGVPARQFDAFKIGVITTDNFMNADVIYEKSLPAIAASLTRQKGEAPYLPIVTGFLGKGDKTGAVTTLGRGGSDLTCTLLGAAMGLDEVRCCYNHRFKLYKDFLAYISK